MNAMRPHLALGVVSLAVLLSSRVIAQGSTRRPIAPETGLSQEINAAIAKPAFTAELARARTQLPLLATTTELLIAREGYTAGLGPFGTIPREPGAQRPGLPQDLCKIAGTLCRCWNGDRDACINLATDPNRGGPSFKLGDHMKFVAPCANLQSQYRQTLQSIMNLLAQTPLSSAQLQQLNALQQRADELYSQLTAGNCLAA